MSPLAGVALVIVALALRLEPLLAVTLGALVTGVCAGLSPQQVVAALGHAFLQARFVSVAFVVLPVIGLAERAGLQTVALSLLERLRGLSATGLLIACLAVRQLSAALGLLALGGQATVVRPLLAPMVESLAPAAEAERVRAHAAAADNIGAFFGEDIFVALGSVLLITAVLGQNGLRVDALSVAMWAIPTALVAFAVHALRLLWLGRRWSRAP